MNPDGDNAIDATICQQAFVNAVIAGEHPTMGRVEAVEVQERTNLVTEKFEISNPGSYRYFLYFIQKSKNRKGAAS